MTPRGAQDRPGQPVPGEFLARVVRTTSASAQASGFVVEVADAQFLVTAAEVVGKTTQRLLVTFERANRMLEVARLGVVGAGRAVVCRVTSANFIPSLDIPAPDWLPVASQPVFSLGYLRGIRGLGGASSVPFVLGGTVAAVAGEDQPTFFLDGSFNPGMVGGPVLSGAVGDEPPRLAGVILGRQPIETKGAAGVLSPGGDRDPTVDTTVTAVLGMGAVVDLVKAAARSEEASP